MNLKVNMTRTLIISAVIVLMIPVACVNNNGPGETLKKPGKDEMAEMNRFLVQKDREIIENYIERKGLSMKESPTGLWYAVEKRGEGELITENDRISIEYRCELIDGTLCYSSDESGPMEITIGKSDIDPGLNEGLRMLKPGGEGIFILPHYLAHGLVGDGKKIPPRTIVVYRITVPPADLME